MASTFNERVAAVSTSLAIKPPVVCTTTANITLSAVQTIDGVSVVAEDRVLVKDQTDGTENGIYRCQAAAWVRAADFDGARDAAQGTVVRVVSGTSYGNTWWEVTTSS